MSEPVKKQNKETPESYSPKDKPEILNMMEKTHNQQHKNSTENVLLGIPYLGYDAGLPVCYAGAVTRLMDYLNDPIDVNELYTLSGISLCFPWEMSIQYDEISVLAEIPQRTFPALGYESEFIYETDISLIPRLYSKEFYVKKIIDSIDNGHPVIGFGITWLNFSCLITGYYNKGEGLYVRAYWKPGNKPMPDGYDKEMYYTTENWYETCHGLLIVGDKAAERLSGGRAYQYIKETAGLLKVKMSAEAMQGGIVSKPRIFYNNSAAFDNMVQWLLDDNYWSESADMGWRDLLLKPCGLFLLDHYRSALYFYLETMEKQYPGLVNPEIRPAIVKLGSYITGPNVNIGNLTTLDSEITDFSMLRERKYREKVAELVIKLKEFDTNVFDAILN